MTKLGISFYKASKKNLHSYNCPVSGEKYCLLLIGFLELGGDIAATITGCLVGDLCTGLGVMTFRFANSGLAAFIGLTAAVLARCKTVVQPWLLATVSIEATHGPGSKVAVVRTALMRLRLSDEKTTLPSAFNVTRAPVRRDSES